MQIGFIGLGTMGAPMARNLLSAGFSVTVWNRTPGRAEALVSAGAKAAASPGAAAAEADVVVIIVSDTPDVEHVLFGPDGVASAARAGTVVVDMSTISPDAERSFGARLAEVSVRLVDAPVSGGSEGAEQATLTIMVGGSGEDVERVRPVLAAMGSKITHVGGLGAGQATKAVNQVIVGGFYLAVAEGMVLGLKSGLDMDKVLEAIGAGACRSWVLENRARNMLDDRYPLGFRLALHLKDERIALDAARQVGVELPLSSMVAAMEAALVDHGYGDEDVSAIARSLGPSPS
jgi:3-hydroxyisobutyrate dehydrogenase